MPSASGNRGKPDYRLIDEMERSAELDGYSLE
jgi:hypothetical protein